MAPPPPEPDGPKCLRNVPPGGPLVRGVARGMGKFGTAFLGYRLSRIHCLTVHTLMFRSTWIAFLVGRPCCLSSKLLALSSRGFPAKAPPAGLADFLLYMPHLTPPFAPVTELLHQALGFFLGEGAGEAKLVIVVS